MARMFWGIMIVICAAVGCSSSAGLDGETADAACVDAAAAIDSIRQAMDQLRFGPGGTAALDAVAADVDGSELSALIESTSSAFVRLNSLDPEDRLGTFELFLETKQAVSELGLWCTRNTTSTIAEEVAPSFIAAS